MMDSVNGYVYGALPGLDMCQGDLVSWHVMGAGTEIDIHTINFHGNVLVRLNEDYTIRINQSMLRGVGGGGGGYDRSQASTWTISHH